MIEAIPDLTPLLKPTTLGDFATYFFAGAGGLLLGGELGKSRLPVPLCSSRNADRCTFITGLAGGAASASSSISKDAESRQRIETAFRRFRADVLRKEADELDKGSSVWDKMF